MTSPARPDPGPARYARQTAVPPFGPETQRLLGAATVAIVGCGALGALQAELLARMGVGALRVADDDLVSLGNLHRQVLFTERDAAAARPKVEAAAERLAALNGALRLHTLAARVTRHNLAAFAEGADLLLDATDNAATRFLLNDYCVRARLPWVYAGVAGTSGLVFPVLPGEGPCLRCLYPDPPAEADAATCATGGILPTTVALAVSLQLNQALRLLNRTARPGTLLRLDAWEPAVRVARVRRDPACPCCGQRRFEFLEPGDAAAGEPPLASSVCSQHLIRIEAAFWGAAGFDPDRARRAAAARGAACVRKGLLWSVAAEDRRYSLFPDGHLLVHDCNDPATALAAARALFLT